MWHQASLPCQQMAWAVPFNPMSLGKVAARMGSSTPHFASVTLGYLGLISETWRFSSFFLILPHFASFFLIFSHFSTFFLIFPHFSSVFQFFFPFFYGNPATSFKRSKRLSPFSIHNWTSSPFLHKNKADQVSLQSDFSKLYQKIPNMAL